MKNFRVSVLLTFKNPITYYLLPITMLYNVGLCTVIDFQKSFKIAVLVYQCLNGQAPSYLADVSSSPISSRVDSVGLTLDFAPSDVAVPPTATGVLLPPAHECGTPCQPN